MHQGLLVVDADGCVRTRNAAAERLLGPTPATPRPRLAEFAPALAERLLAWRQGLGASRTPAMPGSGITPELLATFLDPGRDRAGPVVVLVEDVGRLREQAQQLKLAALGRLTASIAHEIRNPLSSINQAAELLADSAAPAQGQERLVSIIRGNVDRLDRIVTEVLDLNRRSRSEPEAVDLRDALRHFAAGFCDAERLPQDSLRIEAGAVLRALVDRQHLERILWNLARNAWRHGKGQPGSVRVSARAGTKPGTVSLYVIDDGPGLTAEARAHLFEPFFTTDSRGIGLGLFIARELCEGNGGTLEALDGPPGGRFRVTLKEG
jgi:two-component system sensor histidine kinase PilS (NtrC family)